MSTDYPSELVSNCCPLIGFYGLDTNNDIHKSVFESFTANRKSERPSIQFKLIPSNYEFPTAKPKRQSYEWYNPKNILKRNWMLKHLHVLPSLIVLFQEIEWNDPQFSEKQLQCAAHIQQLKNSLTDRNTRLAIVLLQKTAPSLMNDDLVASERAANLTSCCDINAKQLFVLPYNDHLMGYTMRLEISFLELAQSYYIQMIKQIRQHRDMLSATHYTLKVRHQFKLGFISEMRFDYSTALKHYSQAYINIDEIRIVDTNCLEIKTVAGFINFKMCKLMFKLNVPRDSITQFKNHIEKYKSRTGFKELLFEHYAWLSVQYNFFAELFCEAIKMGLPALQTQHPGIYYHKAADYICKRREAFSQVLSMSPSAESSPQCTQFSELYTDFFGVRNAARNSSEPVTEQQIISLVQEMEKKFSYSTAIISLLGQAMAQFKIYKCSRFRKKLAIDMAEEYFKSGEYTKALTLYSLMLSDYRHDKWYKIFTEILLKTLQSAYLAASVTDFISCSIETLSPNIILNKTERLNILENLWKVLENVPPLSQSQIAPELKGSWDTSLSNFKSSVNIDLDQISGLIDCKVSFQKDQIKFNETVALNLYIRSNSEVPIKLKNISIILTTNKKSKVYRLTANNCSEYKINTQTKDESVLETKSAVDFLLEPSKCYKLDFEANQYQFMENVEIDINRVEIKMGGNKNFALLILQKTLNKSRQFQKYDIHLDYIENVKVIPTCYVIPTFHLTTQTIQDNQPMLVNEFYKITTNITNNHDITLQNVGISINLPTSLKNKVFLTTDVTAKTQKLNSLIQFDIGEIQIQSTTAISYYVISLMEGNIELKQNLWYQTDDLSGAVVGKTSNDKVLLKAGSVDSPTSPNDSSSNSKSENENCDTDNRHNISIEYLQDNLMKKMREDIIIVPCVEEIKFVSRFYTLNKNALDKCLKNEDFLMRVNVEVKSPFPLDIVDVCFLSDFNITELFFEHKKKILKNNLERGSKLEIVHMLNAKTTIDQWVTKKTFESKIPTEYQELFVKHKNANPFSFSDKIGFEKTEQIIEDPFISKDEKDKLQKMSSNYTNTQNLIKNIYHEAKDAIEIIENKQNFGRSGFFNCNFNAVNKQPQDCNIFGIYFVKWRKNGSDVVNESKFIINGLEIIEPPINLYCYIDKRLYVRQLYTLKITLKNPTKNILHLQAIFNSADAFMFSGHRQLNITIFSYSSFDLCYNLYPLKVGWQVLPDLQLEYDTSYEETSNEAILTAETMTLKQQQQDIARRQKQVELSNLVSRWMPKMVFVHPPTRKIDSR